MNDFNFYLSMALIVVLLVINLGYTYFKHKEHGHKITWLRFHQDILGFKEAFFRQYKRYLESKYKDELTFGGFCLKYNVLATIDDEYDFEIKPSSDLSGYSTITFSNGKFFSVVEIPTLGFKE